MKNKHHRTIIIIEGICIADPKTNKLVGLWNQCTQEVNRERELRIERPYDMINKVVLDGDTRTYRRILASKILCMCSSSAAYLVSAE
jgi:hypothetical protein